MENRQIFFFLFFFLPIISLAQFNPKVWLRADDGVSAPGQWTDFSGNHRDAQAADGEGPATGKETMNFNPVLLFDGTNDKMTIPYSLEGLSEITMIAVFQSEDTTERGVWGSENGLSRKVALTTRRVTGPDSIVDDYGKNELVPVLSTIVQNWKKSATTGEEAQIVLGSAGEDTEMETFKGTIAELMIFDKTLGFLERRQVETYLALKYGITSSGNYVSSAENLLWDTEDEAEFSYRITGMGKDDAFKLNQKQAQSAGDTTILLTLSAGTLAPANPENTSIINNQDFLIWGDNNMSLEMDTASTEGMLSVLQRKWKMKVSGATANRISTTLHLNLAALPQDSLGYWLVIDRGGQGDFRPDKLEYVLPDSISADSTAIFNEVFWDTDLSGSDMFSFANARELFAAIRTLKEPVCADPESGRIAIEVIGGTNPVQYEMTAKNFSRQWTGKSYEEQEQLAVGRYALTVKDGNNDVFQRDFLLTMPDALAIDLGKDRNISQGQEIALDATTHIPDTLLVSYFWESNNGFSSTEGKVTIGEPGLYKVKVTNEDGCEFGDHIVLSGSAVQKFMVFPSITTTGDFSVGVSLEETESVSLNIYDAKGNVYYSVNGKDSSEYLFKGHIRESGMYLIVLKTSKGMESRKLIVN